MAGIRKDGVKLVVFDFDQTLSVVHVFKALAGWMGPECPVPAPFATSERGQIRRIAELSAAEFRGAGGFAHVVLGGSTRIEMLRQLLHGLREEGTELIVCTKGLVGAVQKCLQDLDLLQFFSAVYGNIGDFYGMQPYDENVCKDSPDRHTRQLLGKEDLGDWGSKAALIETLMCSRGLSKDNCVLVEDDPRECWKAEPVCRTLLVEDAAGITFAHGEELMRMAKKVEVRKVFNYFDLDGDGCISREELCQVIHELNPEWTEADNIKLFSIADLNGDNRIQYSEFVDWVFAGGDAQIGAAMHTGLRRAPDDESISLSIVFATTSELLASVCCKGSDTVASLKRLAELESGKRGPWVALLGSDILDDSKELHAVGIRDGATIAFVRAGRTRVVTSSANGRAVVWNAGSGECIHTLHGHGHSASCVSASADGSLLVIAGEMCAILWDLDTAELLQRFEGHTDVLYSASFSPTADMVVTASHDGTARIWQLETGECTLVVQGHTGAVLSARFSRNEERLVTASADCSACVWTLPDGECSTVLLGHNDWVTSAEFSAHGQMIVTAGYDKTAKLWSAVTGECLRTYSGHSNRIRSACFSPDGESVLTACDDRTARLWDRDGGVELQKYCHDDRLTCAVFSPSGKLVVTGSHDSSCKIWDASAATCLRTFEPRGGSVLSAVYIG